MPADYFQFLYGTIKSEQIGNALYFNVAFQFLYGTIKRW